MRGLMDTLRCGIYCRYSSRLQSQGISLQYQLNYCSSVVKDFNGLIIGEFTDKEKSGYHLTVRQRQGMVELMNAIKLGQINCVVFYDESRLSRRILDFYIEFLDPIREINPDIKFLKGSTGTEWNPDSAEARNNLISALKESSNKSRLAKASQQLKVSLKERPNRNFPLGIDGVLQEGEKQKLITNKGIIIVIFIFHLASWGYSERNIAEILTNIDINIEGYENRDWKHTTIHHILHNPLYIGIGAWDRRISKTNSTSKDITEVTIYNEYDPVIPKELWDLAHYELKRKSTKSIEDGGNIQTRTDTPFFLSSLMFCHNCKEPLNTKNSTKKGENGKQYTKKGLPLKYYFCTNCEFRIGADEIHSLLLNQLKFQLKNFVTKESIKSIPRRWEKYIKKRILNEEEALEVLKFQQLKAVNLKSLSEEDSKRVQELLSFEVKSSIEKISYLHSLKEEIIQLNQTNLVGFVYERLDYFLSNESNLLTNVEQRYMFLSFVEKILVKQDSHGQVHIQSVDFKDLPIPFIFKKINNL
jgi:site-specific DNA recombinase